MFKSRILEDLKKAVEDLGFQPTDIVLSIPKNSQFGDYTTNIALQLAKQEVDKVKQNPQVIAKKIVSRLSDLSYLEKIEVAGSGFINFFIKPEILMQTLHKICDYSSLVNPKREIEAKEKKKILVEFGQPNTHKEIHIGHVRNLSLGESICRLLQSLGNQVYRANYQGDIGLHVAKAIWGATNLGLISDKSSLKEKIKFLGEAYTKGAQAYDEDEQIKKEIDEINKKLYLKDEKLMEIWQKTKKWSLDYLEGIYQKFGIKYDGYFFESDAAPIGEQIVRDNIDKVFVRDHGAIIFDGEKYGLHTRVFITGVGNPTYETKEVGVTKVQRDAFDYDQAIILVANEVNEYFKVVLKAIEMVFPDLQGKKRNLPFGFVTLSSGKMSSRKGNVVTFDFVYTKIREEITKLMKKEKLSSDEKEQIIHIVTIGAIKFSMLKYSSQTDIVFDIKKSISLSGDSGPYLQYTYTRAKSVLRNANYEYQPTEIKHQLESEERSLLRAIEHFENILEEAATKLHPNILASYLLDLAKLFNLFYQKYQIIKDKNAEFRLALTCAVAVVLKQGLYLLGIESPERM